MLWCCCTITQFDWNNQMNTSNTHKSFNDFLPETSFTRCELEIGQEKRIGEISLYDLPNGCYHFSIKLFLFHLGSWIFRLKKKRNVLIRNKSPTKQTFIIWDDDSNGNCRFLSHGEPYHRKKSRKCHVKRWLYGNELNVRTMQWTNLFIFFKAV